MSLLHVELTVRRLDWTEGRPRTRSHSCSPSTITSCKRHAKFSRVAIRRSQSLTSARPLTRSSSLTPLDHGTGLRLMKYLTKISLSVNTSPQEAAVALEVNTIWSWSDLPQRGPDCLLTCPATGIICRWARENRPVEQTSRGLLGIFGHQTRAKIRHSDLTAYFRASCINQRRVRKVSLQLFL